MQSTLPSSEHLDALKTLRRARVFFLLVAVLAPAVHVGAWAAVQLGDVLLPAAASQPVRAPDEPPPVASAPADVSCWQDCLGMAMPLAEFVGRLMIVLLIITLVLTVLVHLSGRLPGVRPAISSLYLAIVVGLLFIPWDRLTPGAAGMQGAFTTLDDITRHYEHNLRAAADASPSLFGVTLPISRRGYDLLLDGFRFALLPLLSIILLLMAAVRAAAAQAMAAPRAESPPPTPPPASAAPPGTT